MNADAINDIEINVDISIEKVVLEINSSILNLAASFPCWMFSIRSL